MIVVHHVQVLGAGCGLLVFAVYPPRFLTSSRINTRIILRQYKINNKLLHIKTQYQYTQV